MWLLMQTTQQAMQTDDTYNLGTMTGVIAVTFIVVEVLKKLINPKTPILGQIPVILLPVLIAPILAILANQVFKDDSGRPFLTGNMWTVIGRALLGAASTSGLYTWLRNPSVTIGESEPLIGKTNQGEDNSMKPGLIFLALGLVGLLGGCQCPERVAIRESMYAGTATARQHDKDWGGLLVAYPEGTMDPRTNKLSDGKDMRDKLPRLAPAQYEQLLKAHADFESLVSEDRSRK